jgi:hypothetical protein
MNFEMYENWKIGKLKIRNIEMKILKSKNLKIRTDKFYFLIFIFHTFVKFHMS